jgi:tetratricopeptide (TPR) repeat protein
MSKDVLALAAIALLGALGVAATQPSLAARFHAVKAREDVYVLPPPEELKVASLGYRAAMAEQIWAKLLVEYGIHWAEKRPFPDIEKYLDAILALDPKFPMLYKFVDTLLVYRPIKGEREDAIKARAYLERGTRERPWDPDVWLHYGEFVAFLAPSWLPDEERDGWRRDGALAIARAVELGADPDRVLPAASILDRTGEQKAAIRNLQRAYALTDDPEQRAELAAKLAQLRAVAEKDEAELDMAFIERRWRRDYPFVRRGVYMLIGPIRDPLACAGHEAAHRPRCASQWDDVLPSAQRRP